MTSKRYLYSWHEGGKLDMLPDNSHWVMLAKIGHNPDDHAGTDFRSVSRLITIVRINNGYGSDGTIPMPEHYGDFAQRLENFVRASEFTPGQRIIWQIGNETNHPNEWPQEQPITVKSYAQCYHACARAIWSVEGHYDDVIMPAPVAPWIDLEVGDWIEYFRALLIACKGATNAISLHTYSRGPSIESITSTAKMGWPYESRYASFYAYRDFMTAIPHTMRHLPVYITETDQLDPWRDEPGVAWIQEAYNECMRWNTTTPDRQIHCLALYRYPNFDQWGIKGKTHVISDFQAAIDTRNHYIIVGDETPDIGEEPMPSTNKLSNGSNEQGFRLITNQWGTPQSSINVAHDWFPWWGTNDVPPEYKPANDAANSYPDRVYQGDGGRQAQQFFWAQKKGMGGLYQRVDNVQAGRVMRFSIQMEMWSSSKTGYDPNDDHDGRIHAKIGIDPYGGTDPESRDIVWSQPTQDLWKYTPLSVEATTMSNRVTVWIWTLAEWSMLHNDVYVDAAQLVYIDQVPEPDPDPGTDPTPSADLKKLYKAHADAHRAIQHAHTIAAEIFEALLTDV